MIIATIADIHFNAVKPEILYEQLNNVFLEYIRNYKVDMVVIAGDFYDSIISFNSKSAKLSIKFITELLKISYYTGIKYIRIIKGTSSHDNNQLENLRIFEEDENVSFRIINTVESEIIENHKILYIPEEYMKNPEEFYEDFFNEEYDIIFGHGMFRETSFQASKQESAITLSKAPIFDSKQFCEMCKGPILFGHIHKSCIIKDKIYYVGSFSRWVYGEEEPKGFMITYLDDNCNFTNTFIENKFAEKYDTYTVKDSYKYINNPEILVKKISEIRKDNLRIILILNGDYDYSYLISFMREFYSKLSCYKLQIVDETEIKRQEENTKKIDDLIDKYKFVFDNTLSHIEKIQKFIEVRDKSNVSSESIKKILKIE